MRRFVDYFLTRPALWLNLVVLVCLMLSAADGYSFEKRKNILVLHSYHKGLSWTDSITRGIEERFSQSDTEVEFTYEFMDTKRYFTKKHLQDIENFFLRKYKNKEFDVIISSDDNAFQFLLSKGDQLFPGVPIVFCGVNNFTNEVIEGRDNITGVQEDFDFATTIEVGLALQQGVRKVVVVGDRTTSGLANRDKLMAVMPKLAGRVSFEILDNHSMEEVQRYVGSLRDDAIVLWLHFTADKEGKFFSFEDSSELISKASTVPLYSSWDFHMKHGIVGGMITSGHAQGSTAADLAIQILAGESAANIPVISKSPNRYMFDYEQMQRYGIKLSRLPEESVVINRPLSLFDNYKNLILSAIVGFGGLSFIILLLTISNVRRQKAEQLATAAKNRYLGIFNDTSVALLVEDFTGIIDDLQKIKETAHGGYYSYLAANRALLSELGRKIKIKDVNPAALKLYGAVSKDELAGNLLRLLKSDSEYEFVDFITALLMGKNKFVVETRNKTLAGEVINVILEVKIPQEIDDYGAVLVSVVDITEMKRAEQALQISETRFRTAFNSAATGMALLSMDGKYQKANKVLCSTLGYEESELLKKTWRDVTHPDDIDKSQQFINRLLQSHAGAPYEKRYLSRSGEIIWTLYSGSLIFDSDGSPLSVISQFQDITRRKEAEAELLEQKERYQRYFEDDLSGIFVVSYTGNFITCNRTFRTIFGIEGSSGLGDLNFFDFFRSEDDSQKFFNTLVLQKKLVYYELMLKRPDGVLLDVIINAIGRFHSSGKLKEIQGYVMDVTQQKVLETQLLQAQKLESIGTMAGGVAHDFNNLLMGVLGNTSLLLLDRDKNDPDYQRLKNIEDYVKSGSSLTKQLLGFAKGGKYEVKTCNINEILRNNSSMFSQTRKEVEVTLELIDEAVFVDVDRSQIDQVMYNLYVNAWQAMADGGAITIRTEIAELLEEYAEAHEIAPGNYVKIEVEDNGEGMPEETLKRIFDPFFTTKEISRGIGLGLASSYGIIQNHAGVIEATSDVGEGTCFVIYLPLSEKNQPDIVAFNGEANVAKGKGKILIVDDEEMIVEVGKQMLSALGYAVETAGSGAAGLEKFKRNNGDFDLVILDMIMPGISGGETFDALKKIDGDVKVILSSGYSLDQKANMILRRGCRGFLQKPFDLQTLSEKIRQVLESKP